MATGSGRGGDTRTLAHAPTPGACLPFSAYLPSTQHRLVRTCALTSWCPSPGTPCRRLQSRLTAPSTARSRACTLALTQPAGTRASYAGPGNSYTHPPTVCTPPQTVQKFHALQLGSTHIWHTQTHILRHFSHVANSHVLLHMRSSVHTHTHYRFTCCTTQARTLTLRPAGHTASPAAPLLSNQ